MAPALAFLVEKVDAVRGQPLEVKGILDTRELFEQVVKPSAKIGHS
jgi:hypothetical protein